MGNTRHGQAFSILFVARAYNDPDGRTGWTDVEWMIFSFPFPVIPLLFLTIYKFIKHFGEHFFFWGSMS